MISALSILRCYSYSAPLGGERQSGGRVPCLRRPAIRPQFGRPPTKAWMRRRNGRGPCLDLVRRMLTSLQGTTRWLDQGDVRHAPGYRALRNAYGRFAALIPRGGSASCLRRRRSGSFLAHRAVCRMGGAAAEPIPLTAWRP